MGGKALDSVCSWLQESPTTALIRPVSLNGCDPYDFSEFPRRIVGMFLEDLDNPLLWSEGEPGAEEAVITRSRSSLPEEPFLLSNQRCSWFHAFIQFSYLHFRLEPLAGLGDGCGRDAQQDGLLGYGELQVRKDVCTDVTFCEFRVC